MTDFDLAILLITLAGLVLGAWSIYWAHAQMHPRRAAVGRTLFVLALLTLGGTAAAAALAQSIALAPSALVSVFLAVAMLWESPAAQWQRE